MSKIRTRFAPSPTGYMHIGNLRTALFEYLIAKHEDGDFILRIEDTDQERLVEGAVDIIYDTLKEVGLTHDEGPDVGGDFGPYVQSERLPMYKKYADELVDFFGVDAVRYFVLHEMPFENDGVITWELMVERLNSDLANTLGNLVNRTISMSNKYFNGVVENKNVIEPVDEDLKSFILQVPKNVSAKMDKLRVADAITEVFSLFKRCNKYIDETMPWALAKDETKQDRLATVLYNLVEGICIGASLLKSFMPRTTERILVQLNANERTLEEMEQFGLYPSGNRVTDKPEILFARLDLKEVLEKVEKLHPKKEEPKEEPKEEVEEEKTENVIDIEAKPEIIFDDFEKLQFQVGEIIACEEVKKSRKLLCSQVKIGSQVRQIVSGIKAHYSAEEMVGKKVMVVTNLKPAKLAGILSEGMILCAEDADGNLSLMVPEKEMPAGAEIC